MTKAIWNNLVLADSDETIIVEGNHYFHPDSVNWEFLTKKLTKNLASCLMRLNTVARLMVVSLLVLIVW